MSACEFCGNQDYQPCSCKYISPFDEAGVPSKIAYSTVDLLSQENDMLKRQIRELKGLKGVIVPVDMPKNCAECPFIHGDLTERCPFLPYSVWSEWALSEVPEEESGTERHPDCPLREVP